jgi:hypothetical protein
MKREFIVEREGRSFVLYAGLLDEAHQQGLKSIQTTLLQVPAEENGYTAICQAVVETDRGRFSGIGDASPENVTRIMRQHLIRMAETRAKARALRDAVNVGVAALEELGDEIESSESEPEFGPTAAHAPERTPSGRPRAIRERSDATAAAAAGARTAAGRTVSGDQATPAQVNAIYAIGRRELHWTEEDVDAHCRGLYGKAAGDLSKREASELIDRLKTNPSSVA